MQCQQDTERQGDRYVDDQCRLRQTHGRDRPRKHFVDRQIADHVESAETGDSDQTSEDSSW